MITCSSFSSKTKMADECVTCGSLCVYLIFFLRISYVLSSNDQSFYEIDPTHHRSEHFLALQLLDDEYPHTYHKREVPDPQSTIGAIYLSNSTGLPNVTEEITIPPPKKNSEKLQKPIYPTNATKLLKDGFPKNLGENGAGQRKIPPPPLLHNSSLFVKNNQTGGDDSEIAILKSPVDIDIDTESGEKKFNETLISNNITTKTDYHQHYNSSFYTDPEIGQFYWVDMENRTDVKINELLSNSHRRAATIKLSFEFPFYGHLIKNVTIATGGFLYTGDYVHSWLAATQYIAPLMANFDTSLSNDSFIKYVDNGTAFIVQWEKVMLQEKPEEGEFTFQVILHKSGDIVFIYQNVPLYIENIKDIYHPVKIGLSDAYILDRTVLYVRRKTIYEYHRVNFKKEEIKNGTVIYLKALPSCLDNHDCNSCLTSDVGSDNQCFWCPTMNKCSTGFDRNRQSWVAHDCDAKRILNETTCSHLSSSDDVYLEDNYRLFDHLGDSSTASRIYTNFKANKKQQENVGLSGIVAILFLVAMVSGLAVWIFYAYRNPHTTSGQILIRYRPSQWRWKRGEARYTAATIHM